MREKSAFVGIALLLCLSIFYAIFSEDDGSPIMTHASYYLDIQTYEDLYIDLDAPDETSKQIYGAVLPHHLFVGREHAKFFSYLDGQDPEVIVVVGPNHNNLGGGNIQATVFPYTTPYGVLKNDKRTIHKLSDLEVLTIDDDSFNSEHSISSEVGFIKKHFPDTKIVPIITKYGTTREESEELGKALAEVLPSDSLVLASVDFSHYQPEVVADMHDKTSLSTIQNFDFDSVFDLEIDSPASIYSLLTYLEERNAQKLDYIVHTNSASYSHQPEIEETTSHHFLAFTKGKADVKPVTSFLFFGDTMFDRGIKELEIDTLLNDIKGLENRFFMGNHVNIANLEGPVTDMEEHQPKNLLIKSDDDGVLLLKKMDFNVYNLANNHIKDYLDAGVQDTVDYLDELNIDYIGTDEKPCTQFRDVSICGFNMIERDLDVDEMLSVIRNQDGDRIVVNMHWGIEYTKRSIGTQRDIAHKLIDKGVDLIVGHHPHVVQELEIYKGKPIVYSLGNFIFDQIEGATRMGLGLGAVFGEEELILYFYPFWTNGGKPRLFDYKERQKFYKQYGVSSEGKIILN